MSTAQAVSTPKPHGKAKAKAPADAKPLLTPIQRVSNTIANAAGILDGDGEIIEAGIGLCRILHNQCEQQSRDNEAVDSDLLGGLWGILQHLEERRQPTTEALWKAWDVLTADVEQKPEAATSAA